MFSKHVASGINTDIDGIAEIAAMLKLDEWLNSRQTILFARGGKSVEFVKRTKELTIICTNEDCQKISDKWEIQFDNVSPYVHEPVDRPHKAPNMKGGSTFLKRLIGL